MAEGGDVYLDTVNRSGGVHGRKVEVITIDDGYDPKRSVEGFNKLVRQDKVFAIFSSFGGAATKALIPEYDRQNIPAIAISASPEEFRAKLERNLFFVRPSSQVELGGLIRMVADNEKIKSIASVYQDDAVGKAGNFAVHTVAKERALEVKYTGGIQRNTREIQNAVDGLMKNKADAVVLSVKPDAGMEIIKECAKKNHHPFFLVISASNSNELISFAMNSKTNLYYSSAAPLISSSKLKVVERFLKDAKAAGITDPDSFHMEGYLGAMVLVEALRRNGPELDRASLRKTLEKMNDVDFGGVSITYSKDSHRGSAKAYFGRIKDGENISLD